MKEKKTSHWKEHLVESLQIPRDLAFQESVITLTGEHEVLLENYRGILEYTETHLLVLTRHCRIGFWENIWRSSTIPMMR